MAKQNWESHFFAKKTVIAERHFFSQKRCSSVKVGLFAGLTIAASCARAAPGSPEGKQAFSKIAKFKLQAFPKGANPLLKPLLKNSFSTIFQGPGPGEAPFHFSRFVCWVHYCSKLCQSSPWKPRREASLFQNCQIQTPSLSKGANPLLNPY